jgi:hypothetical protein
MATLSLFKDGSKAASIAASPIYLISALAEPGLLVFELLAKDASALTTYLGIPQLFALDGDAFWGRLEHLQEAAPMHPTMIALGRPAMRGAIRRLSEADDVEFLQ